MNTCTKSKEKSGVSGRTGQRPIPYAHISACNVCVLFPEGLVVSVRPSSDIIVKTASNRSPVPLPSLLKLHFPPLLSASFLLCPLFEFSICTEVKLIHYL